ncbi:hypothetical protein ACX93W_05110 [Paenibacillus sp. CAU 1782]
MFYEKLKHIYNNSNCKHHFQISVLESLHTFIQQSLNSRKKNINPHDFSKFTGLTLKSSLQFLLYFSDKDGVFEVVYFFECTKSVCNNRIYLVEDDLNSSENVVACEECGNSYVIGNVQEYIRAHFRVRKEYLSQIPKITTQVSKVDPKSTFEALKGLSDDLKQKSPSSLDEFLEFGEGDEESVALDQLDEGNIDESGEQISRVVSNFLMKCRQRY